MNIKWDGNGHSAVREGRFEGEVVARILKQKNHTHKNTGIYVVEVGGVQLIETYRYVDDAKAAVKAELQRGVKI